MQRRRLIVRPLVAAPLVALAGCTPVAAPNRPPARVRLQAPLSAGRMARVDAWNVRFGHLATLEVEPAAGGAAPAAGSSPDLLWTPHEALPALALSRRLRPLDGLVRAGRYDLKRFMPCALQPGYGPDQRLYALPDTVDARQLYFNRSHLEDASIDVTRAGFDFERPALTWEALRLVVLDLGASPRARERLPIDAAHAGAPLELWAWQNGGAMVAPGGRRATLDRPENVAALEWLVLLAQEAGGAARLDDAGRFPPPAGAGDETDQPDRHPFVLGRVSLCFESTRFPSTVAGARPDLALGYVEPPRRREGRPLVSWCGSTGYAAGRAAPDAAWDVLRFLVSADAALVDAAAAAREAPVAGAPPAGTEGAAGLPLPGRRLWFPPYTGQLAIDKRHGVLFRTGSKRLDEAWDHGLEQLRHARYREPCPAPEAIWPALQAARESALRGTPAAVALAEAQRAAQARLDDAWRALA